MDRRNFLASLVIMPAASVWTPWHVTQGWTHYYKTVNLGKHRLENDIWHIASSYPLDALKNPWSHEYRPLKQHIGTVVLETSPDRWVRYRLLSNNKAYFDFYARPSHDKC